MSQRRLSGNSESGYALLMVFLMAAIVALMLYQQLPRVAFETEREKEQLLIDRGEQYIRAIQLYYVANNRQLPTSIDDLEKKEKRFLRRRYVDPYTGKDEWRIIHGNGTLLTDSLVQKPAGTTGATDSSTQTASTTAPSDGQPQVNAAVLQRPSDRPTAPVSFNQQGFNQQTFNQQGGQDASGQQVGGGNSPLPPITLQTGQAGQPGGLPPITLQPAGPGNPSGGLPPITLTPTGGAANGTTLPGQVPGQLRTGIIPGQAPGQQGPGPIPGVPSSAFPGQPATGGLPGGLQTGIPPGFRIDPSGQLVPIAPVPGQTPPGFPGQPPAPTPGQDQTGQVPATGGQPASQDSNSALNLINQLLTNPRQNTTQTTPVSGGQVGGIAGIASTHRGPSIKVYKDQTQYELWEFVFSATNSTVPGAGAGGTARPGASPSGTAQPGTFAPSNTFGSPQSGTQSGTSPVTGR
jgi:hypothetical protein